MIVLKEQQHKHVQVKKPSQEIETLKVGLEGKGRRFCFGLVLLCVFVCFVWFFLVLFFQIVKLCVSNSMGESLSYLLFLSLSCMKIILCGKIVVVLPLFSLFCLLFI